MKSISSKIAICTMVAVMSSGIAFTAKESVNSKAWAGVSYYASQKGATAKQSAVINAVAVVDSAIQGAAWGAAFGGPAGVVASVVVGL